MLLVPTSYQFSRQCPAAIQGEQATGKCAAAISFRRQKEFRLMDVGSLNPVGGSVPGGSSCEMLWNGMSKFRQKASDEATKNCCLFTQVSCYFTNFAFSNVIPLDSFLLKHTKKFCGASRAIMVNIFNVLVNLFSNFPWTCVVIKTCWALENFEK